MLSQHLISHPGNVVLLVRTQADLTPWTDLVRNKRVLELGSGAGFLGIIIASLQQSCVSNQSSSSLWLTDVNEEVLARCRHNLQMSCSECRIFKYCIFDFILSMQRLFVLPSQHQLPLAGLVRLPGSHIVFTATYPPARRNQCGTNSGS